MEECGGMYFTIWYGVYHRGTRRLSYASAGHPPAYLGIPGEEELRTLHTANLAAGMLADSLYDSDSTVVSPGGRLYVFSDGVFEFFRTGGEPFSFDDFVPILAAPPAEDATEVERIERSVRELMGTDTFPDDFSLLVVEFSGESSDRE
jgi:sigma-B regulation protein RsbU (phosphoserine phosphatase)